ncbi:biotin--[acetyl-CoA-carboxylase] ligase [Pyrococcus sp. NA2]|uniref:biotin--[acetyl-CoA-carboxylase] ligase n=1 Tax=Pyrococcus sp. (strain NA2) TaxID=342949 RepID=UPI00064FBE3D|nr:biotin--[acetyl-CoA-carboxylase] ligase [Pyrococcus sp. NA2]
MLGLGTSIVGKQVIYLREVTSTNEYALLNNFPEGTVIVADRQIKGRGRLGRKWESPEGGLWMSVVLKPRVSANDLPKLVFLGALSVIDVLKEFAIEGRIKWPNDVLVNYRKISGILVEGRGDNFVLGIGLNVNNEVPEGATSIKAELGTEVSLTDIFKKLVLSLDELYSLFLKSPSRILELARENMILGVRVRVGNIEGIAEDVDDFGALIVRLDTGETRRVVHGDVSLRFLEHI